MEKNNLALKEIIKKLASYKYDPVDAVIHGGNKFFMENIVGTTKYLSNAGKVIYDLMFADLYYHDKKVPLNHVAIGEYLYKIEACVNLDDPEKFLGVLNFQLIYTQGTKFYLDNVLYAENMPFTREDKFRDLLLEQRWDGTLFYHCLKIVDPAGNTTEFWASPAVEKRMKLNKPN